MKSRFFCFYFFSVVASTVVAMDKLVTPAGEMVSPDLLDNASKSGDKSNESLPALASLAAVIATQNALPDKKEQKAIEKREEQKLIASLRSRSVNRTRNRTVTLNEGYYPDIWDVGVCVASAKEAHANKTKERSLRHTVSAEQLNYQSISYQATSSLLAGKAQG